MTKRAVDLSVEELAALGMKAARRAVQESQNKGLTITGVIETFEGDQARSSLAQLHPSGIVTLVETRTPREFIEDFESSSQQVRSSKKVTDN